MSQTVLYISCDGILEPLGQSQVLRCLERLAPDHKIVLMSLENPDDWQQCDRHEAFRFRNQMRATGIAWIPLRHHKRPSALATAFDIAQGAAVGAWAVIRHRMRIVHDREASKARAQVFSNDKSVDHNAKLLFPSQSKEIRL